MNKNHILIVAIAVLVLVTAGVVFFWKSSPQKAPIANFTKCAEAGYPVGESYPRQCWTPDGGHFVEDIPKETPKNVPVGPVTVSGEITCLPKKGSGPQTLECAIGLKGDDNRYYGLKNLFEVDPEYRFAATGTRVTVSGALNQEAIKGPDGNPYDVVGVISIDFIK